METLYSVSTMVINEMYNCGSVHKLCGSMIVLDVPHQTNLVYCYELLVCGLNPFYSCDDEESPHLRLFKIVVAHQSFFGSTAC